MISETAYSSPTKLIGYGLHASEHRIGYSNLNPDPWGPGAGHLGVSLGGQNQISSSQKVLLTKVVGYVSGVTKIHTGSPSDP